MIFDTDVLIWVQRGNAKAAAVIDKTDKRAISALTYMELLQCAQNKTQHQYVKSFLVDFNFILLPVTESISHRASIYIEEYSISNGITAADALIAATAIEHDLQLVTANVRHFKVIQELNLVAFKP